MSERFRLAAVLVVLVAGFGGCTQEVPQGTAMANGEVQLVYRLCPADNGVRDIELSTRGADQRAEPVWSAEVKPGATPEQAIPIVDQLPGYDAAGSATLDPGTTYVVSATDARGADLDIHTFVVGDLQEGRVLSDGHYSDLSAWPGGSGSCDRSSMWSDSAEVAAVALLIVILLVVGLAIAVNMDRGGQHRLREFNRTRSSPEVRTFELGGHAVTLTWSDGWVRGDVGGVPLEVSLLQRGAHSWTLLWQLRSIGVEVGGAAGAIERSARSLRIHLGDRTWRTSVRTRGGLHLLDGTGRPLAAVGPWDITPVAPLSADDAAVAVLLVVCGLDVYRGPAWVRILSAVGLRRGWPRPFPDRRWNRRYW